MRYLQSCILDASLSGAEWAEGILRAAYCRFLELTTVHPSIVLASHETALLRHHQASLDLIAEILKPQNEETE
jgi:hypothetical protein